MTVLTCLKKIQVHKKQLLKVIYILTDLSVSSGLFVYRAFGLTIASQLPLPELPGGLGTVDITVEIGTVPAIEESAAVNRQFQAGADHLLLHVENVGGYFIGEGRRIIVQPDPYADINAVRLFLLGSAMGALLIQRGLLPIHGSAVVNGDYCFIITGGQGAGKSTLAAALRDRGYAILSDDISAIDFDARGLPVVYPSYPRQKLWRDTLQTLGYDESGCEHIFGRVGKFKIGIENGFCAEPKQPAGIYELNVARDGRVTFHPVSGLAKLALIMNNIYRPQYVSGLGRKEKMFRMAALLTERIEAGRISRPAGIFSLPEQILLLETNLAKEGEIYA